MRYLFFLFCVPLLLILSGCWDSLEIENRAFVSGVAIDPVKDNGDKNLKMMTQVVIPNGLVSLPNNSSGGEKSFRNVSSIGKTIFEVKSSIEEKEDGDLDNSHIEIVIISDELVKSEYKISDIIDVFMRESRMNRDIILAVANGSSEELLNIDPENVKLPSQYITELIKSNYKLADLEPETAGVMQYFFIKNKSFYLPYLENTPSTTGIQLGGVAVFEGENGKMVGILKGDEITGLALTRPSFSETLIVDHNGQKGSFTIPDGRDRNKTS